MVNGSQLSLLTASSSSMNRRHHTYRPLESTASEIRILTLYPISDVAAELKLGMVHANLRKSSYCALSYTWGEEENLKTVALNDEKIHVNANLEEALRAVALLFGAPVDIWADAICINQQDSKERAEQVKIMREIFAKAEFVIAWIGRKELNDELGFRLMHELARRFDEEKQSVGPISGLSDSLCEWLTQTLEDRNWESTLKALFRIYNRPWWSRAWVIQEVAVSSRAYLMCGDLVENFEKVFRAAAVIQAYSHSITSGLGSADEIHHRRADVINYYPEIVSCARSAATLSTEQAYQIFRSILGENGSTSRFEAISGLPMSTFAEIVNRLSGRRCSDPRDKVYAFMGLAMSRKEIDCIQVDYDLDISQLYRRVIRAHLEVHRNLKVLDGFSGSDRPEGFSSWAYDKTPTAYQPVHFEVEELGIRWDASRNIPANFKFLGTNGENLALRGLQLDEIDAIGPEFTKTEDLELPPYDCNEDSSRNVYMAWQELAGIRSAIVSCIETAKASKEPTWKQRIEAWKNLPRLNKSYPTGQSILDAFIQTMMLDPQNVEEYSKVYLDRCPTLTTHGRSNVFSDLVFGDCFINRRFFVTKGGYFGLGPKTTSHGDIVCVIFGAPTPYILRKWGSHHIVIGWSYLHGVMNGEAVQKLRNGTIQEVRFLLR